MNHSFMRPTLAAAAVGAAFLAVGGQAVASGFQLQEQSASGLGVAYSGMAAAVQDASTAFWNPAGMTYLSGKNVERRGPLHLRRTPSSATAARPSARSATAVRAAKARSCLRCTPRGNSIRSGRSASC